MSMKYKLVQRKDFSKDASPDSKLYYAQIVNNGTVDLKELCENIAEESALSSADVRGVFDRLTRQLRTHLQNGRTVVIDGFGSFRPTVGSKGVANEEDFDAATMMRTPKIVFTPHADLRETYNKVVYERISNKKKEESSEPSTEPDEYHLPQTR